MNLFKRFRRKRSPPVEETILEPAGVPGDAEGIDAREVLGSLAESRDIDEAMKHLDRHLDLLLEEGQGEVVGQLIEQIDEEFGRRGEIRADRLALLGSLYQRRDGERETDKRRAIDLYAVALEGYRRVNEREGTAITLNNMGLALCELAEVDPEQFKRAIPVLEEALEYFEENEEITYRATICMTLGEAYSGLPEPGGDHFELAREYFERAWALFERAGMILDQAAAQGRLGDVMVSLAPSVGPEALEKGVRHYRNALSIYLDRGETDACGTYQQRLGAAYVALGGQEKEHLRKGLRAYERALEMFRQSGNQEGVGRVCLEVASLRLFLEEGEEEFLAAALERYFEALKVFEELGMEVERGKALQGLARIYLNGGEGSEREDLDQGVALLEEAAEIFARANLSREYQFIHEQLRKVRSWLVREERN
ncbi:MAG: hypothetical protein HOC74_08560 [Gemmatimonadetes bacterium]|jgi:tetratricopeptide (TPR) repeat protein|nr:hypothetical protein [Gemmatimonadota bacterium]